MKYRLRYAYYDLGELEEGSTALVRMSGSRANVTLLDARNFARYRAGQPFAYVGGNRRRSPVRLEVPHDGHWYVVLDLGGFGGRARGAVSVLGPDGARLELSPERTEVDSDQAPEPIRT